MRSDLIVSALAFGSRSPDHVPDCSLGLYVDFLWSESSLVGQFYWNEFTTLSCSPIIRVAFQQMQA